MKSPETEDWMKDAPRLAAMSRENPFAVPPGYFEEFSATMDKAVESPMPVKGTDLFAVPDGYFEKLPYVIQEKIRQKSQRKVRPVLLRPVFAISAVAAFLAVLLLTKPGQHTVTPETNAVALSAEDLEASGYMGEFDETSVMEVLGNEGAASQNADIEDYLIENHIELSQLTNEF